MRNRTHLTWAPDLTWHQLTIKRNCRRGERLAAAAVLRAAVARSSSVPRPAAMGIIEIHDPTRTSVHYRSFPPAGFCSRAVAGDTNFFKSPPLPPTVDPFMPVAVENVESYVRWGYIYSTNIREYFPSTRPVYIWLAPNCFKHRYSFSCG